MRALDRKGDWTQLFMVFFFVLILIFSIALLALDQGKLRSNRATLSVDLSDQEANVQLISLLRHSAVGGFAGDGSKASIASIITLSNCADEKCMYDDMLLASVEQSMPDTYYYELHITYPAAELLIANTKYDGQYRQLLRDNGPAGVEQELSNKATTPEWRAQNVPRSSAVTILPGAGGNIRVELLISERIGDAAIRMQRGGG